MSGEHEEKIGHITKCDRQSWQQPRIVHPRVCAFWKQKGHPTDSGWGWDGGIRSFVFCEFCRHSEANAASPKGPFLPNSTPLPSPDVLWTKLTSPDHPLMGVHCVHMYWGTHSLWVTVLPCVSRQLLNSGGIYQATAGYLLPHPAPCLWGQRLSPSRAGS